ncbi:MAG TPA: VCBS repeat-containing protein [Thermoguttaceae bacterium]|nr:VCBS repeat-containing protein [Thermoguttaceae bacterium]
MGGERKHRRALGGALGILALVVCAIVAFLVWRPSSPGARPQHPLSSDDGPSSAAPDGDTESRIVAFCSDCHAMPRAESFPRHAWHDRVRKGYEFYAQSGRNDLDPPPVHVTAAYFRAHAPERQLYPEPVEAETELGATFAVEQVTLAVDVALPPAISHLRWTRLEPDGAPVLVVCDMRHGGVVAVGLRGRGPRLRTLARLNNPCHVEACDLDADGAIDLVVADLGSFLPDDHDRGRVVWLRRREASGRFDEVVLASGLGRVADARPADLDGDGDLDVLVADFGWHRTGQIVLLRNVAGQGEPPRFETEQIDPRPGTIHVPVHDFDRDGRPDFVALVSQEYESLDMFLNQGDARFRLRTLWTGPDLTFGSSGIELTDLDQDGDMDVLYTNGDSFDNSYVNPSHGVQWLENVGRLEFAYHRLTGMLGVHRALAGDVDGDGDLDVVAVSMLPDQFLPREAARRPPASILCLEQTSPGVFVRHTLEAGSPYYATLELADFDDGDLDFAVGPHSIGARDLPHRLSIWRNQRISTSR